MSFLGKLKNAIPAEDSFDDDYIEKPRKPAWSGLDSVDDGQPEKRNKVVNIHATAQLQVVLIRPEGFANAREIADHLHDKRTVVMNLEKTPDSERGRIKDFVSGAAYAQDGKMKRVAVNIYIVTPYNVDIMGDLLDELENNGVYFS